MNRGATGIFLSLALIVFLVAPLPTHAMKATFFGPIVPPECRCNDQTIQGPDAVGTVNTAPDYGCVLQTAENGVNFGVTLSVILFTIYLVITGFSFMLSGGSSEARSAAKTRFMNVFIGLAVLLCAWLIIDYIMKTIYNEGRFGPWNALLEGSPTGQDRCIVPRKPTAISVGQVGFAVPAGTSASNAGVTGVGTAATGSSHLNIPAATNYLTSHYTGTSSNHRCLSAIQLAFQAAGAGSLNCPGNGSSHYAGTCGPVLLSKGFVSLGSSDPNPQAGDIIVVPGNQYSSIGHIAMYTGTRWISDFVQSGPNPYPSPQPPAQFYRP